MFSQTSAFRKMEYMYSSLSFPLRTAKTHQHYVQNKYKTLKVGENKAA